MIRPCNCDRQQGGEWVIGRDCRLCWLYHNDARYAKLWNDVPSSPRKPRSNQTPLHDAEIKELFGDADETLLGNRIAALTTALGFPPCGGCGQRREWLNRAHQWLRSVVS